MKGNEKVKRTNTGHRGGPKTRLTRVQKALIAPNYFRPFQEHMRRAAARNGGSR